MDRDVLRMLEYEGVSFIRIVWCDNGNAIRAKAVHRDRMEDYVEHGVGISVAQQSVPVTIDAPAPNSGFGPVGEVRLVPDMATLMALPYASGHARVMGDMMRDGKPWPLCPRTFLKRMISEASARGIEICAAFENEFYLIDPSSEPFAPADQTAFASTFSMDLHLDIINTIAEALAAQSIEVEQYYPESGPGQQEISVRYSDALDAADRQIAFRETVRAVARQNGLVASFVPKVFTDRAGSGCHLHLSLWRGGRNLVPDETMPGGLSEIARRFMAGILDHLPALMAITTPIPNSYARIRPHCWSGAFRCWGYDNREAAIRIPTHPEPPGPTHFELKTVDAASNPFLALGAVIAAGLDGIDGGKELPEEVQVDPGSMEESLLAQKGIDPLPASLRESLELLEKDDVLLKALGPDLARAYLAVRHAEMETLDGWGPEEEVRFLLERY